MLVRSEGLTGNALIWAVCHALGHAPVVAATGIAYRSEHGAWVYPRYLDNTEVGVLMSAEMIGVERPSLGQTSPQWRAVTDDKTSLTPNQCVAAVVSAEGPSLGVAVCRALVRSRIGDVIDVPDTLVANVKGVKV